MKKVIVLLTGLFLIVLATQNAYAQPGASDQGTASAFILTPLSIAADADLEFGSIAAGSSSSDVKMSTAGLRTLESGDAVLHTMAQGQQGTFDVEGEPNYTFAITLPANGVVTLSGPGTALVVKDFVSDPATTSTLDGSGDKKLNVGATLVVPSGQAAGTYSGTYTVTVDYN